MAGLSWEGVECEGVDAQEDAVPGGSHMPEAPVSCGRGKPQFFGGQLPLPPSRLTTTFQVNRIDGSVTDGAPRVQVLDLTLLL